MRIGGKRKIITASTMLFEIRQIPVEFNKTGQINIINSDESQPFDGKIVGKA